MRVLITRPEREATALATALAGRGHQPVIAPLFQLEILAPPADFAAALAACQAVLMTSANGARALAEASEQRSKPVFAVGDTTAATAEGLGFATVVSAGGDGVALAELVRQRLGPDDGPLVHVSGVDVAGELGAQLGPRGFEVRRFALYEAREVATLPDSARAALEARAIDAATFFSPRAGALFARLVSQAGLAPACRAVTAVAISPPAMVPLRALPFKATLTAVQPTRQAVLDVIDRLAEAGYQGAGSERPTMSDTSPSQPAPPPQPIVVKRGLGLLGTFVTGLVAAAFALSGAVASLPYWPERMRALWQGGKQPAVEDANRTMQSELVQLKEALARQQDEATHARAEDAKRDVALEAKQHADAAAQQAASDAGKRELDARLDDLEKRVRAAATTAAQADRPANDPAIAELRTKVAALESRPSDADTVKEVVALKGQIAELRKAIDEAAAKAQDQAKALDSREAKTLSAARSSAVIGIAARLSAALDSGQPFAADIGLLLPFIQDDAKLGEMSANLKPLADKGVATLAGLAADYPAAAKAALADDLADDSFSERLLAKLKGLVSLRRVGDVPGDSVEAKLARAETALAAGDLATAAELVKSLPPQTSRATAAWLARADAHLAAQRAIDQLAAHAVAMLGAAHQSQ